MPLGDDIHRVQAQTLNPTFLDYYRQRGGDYSPAAIGERGFMYETEAQAAQVAGDVLDLKENTPYMLETGLLRPPLASYLVPGDGAATHIVFITPGTSDGAYILTLTMAIDGGLDLVAETNAAIAGATAEEIAADLAAQVVAGVTLEQDGVKVYLTPDAGEFTKFEFSHF